MRFVILIVATVTIVQFGTPAWAGGRRQQRQVDRANDAHVAPAVTRGRAPAASTDSGRYPKFTGGFHSRELQNIGVPTGDIGLRGNGFSMFPW